MPSNFQNLHFSYFPQQLPFVNMINPQQNQIFYEQQPQIQIKSYYNINIQDKLQNNNQNISSLDSNSTLLPSMNLDEENIYSRNSGEEKTQQNGDSVDKYFAF